ncbi:MAG: type II toxin-antitoxin system VapC family toxin [Alphaproteobacteria bacterium]|nr:type II toxin-antitoxin system VapC family toxin [Alphaproteobacteria bacterium]
MRLLIDTHVALWWWRPSRLLSEAARQAIASADLVFVSVVTGFEIANKYRLGKLDMLGDPAQALPALMSAHDFSPLPVTDAHALAAGLLPGDHRDPFDRLIAAQALAEGLTVVTRDSVFTDFGCKVLW